eukprot:augustus_masked-scaffold_34-processed-gene-1.7-mRNA-1 protein AED:1.00 eAED:1.00 QI:0/0/0/0/1/1/12/0/2109
MSRQERNQRREERNQRREEIKKKLEEEEERRRKEEAEDAELFESNSSSEEEGEDSEGRNEEIASDDEGRNEKVVLANEGRNEEAEPDGALSSAPGEKVEEVASAGAKENVIPTNEDGAAEEARHIEGVATATIGAPRQAESDDSAENTDNALSENDAMSEEEAEGKEVARNENEASKLSREVLNLTQFPAKVRISGDSARGRSRKSLQKKKWQSCAKEAAKEALSQKGLRILHKDPSLLYTKYVVCEDDLRQAQRKMKGKRAVEMLEEKNIHQSSTFPLLLMIALSEAEIDKVPLTERVAHMLAAVPNFRENKEVSFGQLVSMRKKVPIKLAETNTPTWFFRSSGDVIDANIQCMADRGMALIKGNMPKPNVGIREDPTRPRRVNLFRWVVKADPLVEKSLVTPKRKIRRSEHRLTDKESRLQSRISSLTNKNDRLKVQAHAAESMLRDKNSALMRMAVNETKKKHKAEIKRLLDEVKNLKGLYRAENEKNQDLQQEVFDKDSVVERTQRRFSNPGSQATHAGTLSDFAEVRSIAAATQGSVHTLETKLTSMAALLEKLTEASAQSLARNAHGSEESRRSEELRARRDENARRDRQWKNTSGKFKTLTTLRVKDIRAMLDMRDAYLEVYENEREPNLWIHVDPELKQSLSRARVTKQGLVDYLRKYMREHEAYEGEDTLRTIMEKVAWPQEGAFLARLNNHMNSATGCIKWDQLRGNSQRFEILRTLNKRLPLQLRLKDDRIKAKLEAPGSKLADSVQEWKKLIQAIYDARLNMDGEVSVVPPNVADDAPRTSDVRRTAPNIRDASHVHAAHIEVEGTGTMGTMHHEGMPDALHMEIDPLEEVEERSAKNEHGFARHLNVSFRRAAKSGVSIHHTGSGDRIPNAILDSGADESVASLYKHAWMMDSIEDVKEKITLADGTTDLRVTKVGYADLEMRVGGIWKRDFRRVKVFLVDDKKWKELLVGAPALGQAGLMPSCFADSAEVVSALMQLGGGKLEVLGDIPAARAASIDFSRRLRDGNAEGIPFDETIHLKQNKDVVDEDNLEQLMLPEGNALYRPEAERAEIREAIVKMVEAAGEVNESQRNQLRELCFKYEVVFATNASQIGISLLAPMDVVPIRGAEFKMPAPRPLGPGKAEFVKEKLDGMVKKGMARKVRQAIYGSVVFAVPNKNNTWRMVLDLVAVIKVLHRDVNILPILEMQLGNTAPARFYGCLDVVIGFDQLAITDRAKKYFNLMTTYGVFQLQFVPMGYHSTPVFFHQRMVDHIVAENYNKEGNGIVQLIDDTLIHAKDFKRYIRILEDVLRNLRKWKVRISPTKSILFTTSIEYYGRILQNGGWNFSKKYYEKILLVPKPEYVYELAKLLRLVQWLTSAKLLKEKKLIFWNKDLEATSKRFTQKLADAPKARVQHYDQSMDLILVTDASDNYHNAILFQARQQERGKDLMKKKIYPMMFFSGKFDAIQLVWGICHKELYPIIRTFNKLSYLLPFHPTAVQVYTDHLNLKAILQGGSKINHGHLNRLQRWMVILQHVLVDIHHIDGDSNIFADMLTRWAAPTNNNGKAAVRMKGDLYFRIRRNFEDWMHELLQPKRRKWIKEVSINVTPKHFIQPSATNCRQIVRRIMRKSLPGKNTPDLMKEVERQIRKEYSKEEWRKLTEDYATWPTEVPSDVSDTNKERYIEMDTYSTVNHLRPKRQMEKKIYASLRSLDKYRESVFNPYFEGNRAPLMEPEVIEVQKKEMITRTYRIKKLSGKIILPASLLERQLVHIHLANKHGSLESDLAEAARLEWRISAAMERTLRGDTSRKKMVELIRVFRDNCVHCRRLPKAIKTTYSLVTRARHPRETLVADFLYVNRIGHILVLTDAFSRFTQLTHTKAPDTQAVIEVLDRFATNYKLEKEFTLVTDRGSHFANSLMSVLRKELRFSQSFALFLYVNPERQYIEPAGLPPLVERIRKGASMLVSIDADVLYKLSATFRIRLEEYEKKVAKYVEFQKMLNNRRKKTAVDPALLQYNVGDWCLLSSKGTLKDRDKLAHEWSGPVQIMETVSKNVYKIKASDGKAMEVHGSGLYFYEPSGFVPSEALRNVHVGNFKHLEVAEFGDVKYDPHLAEYIIEV